MSGRPKPCRYKIPTPNKSVEASQPRSHEIHRVDPALVAVKTFDRILTVKVVLPRRAASGSLGDTDVYGSQQHFPLGDLEV